MSSLAGSLPVSLLARILCKPTDARTLDLAAWARLIGQARNAELLGQLRARLDEADCLGSVPEPARRHLEMAWQLSLRHREAVHWELDHIRHALRKLDVPVVVLKGAAYCLAGLPAAEGRVFNDVDIMVSSTHIRRVENALIDAGWIPQIVNPYDQRYYREWMHEIPPLEHKSRGTVLDVHHTIVPPTSGVVPDPGSLLARAVRSGEAESAGFLVLAPEDMVLHSAVHLFFNEFHKGLRDLYDLHRLMGLFGRQADFWERLLVRAEETGLQRPLLDAVFHCQRVFASEVPDEVRDLAAAAEKNTWLARPRAWMMRRVLLPDHPSTTTSDVRFARWLAFVRSHWLRMPPHLLAWHLLHKAFRREA